MNDKTRTWRKKTCKKVSFKYLELMDDNNDDDDDDDDNDDDVNDSIVC
jgi:hypothetical protein